LGLVLGLASLSFLMRGAGPFLPSVSAGISERTSGLAPALLAALVAIQLTGHNGVLHPDIKLAAVLIAAALATLRVPLLVCVFSGALVAALARAFLHVG
jgi:hypothetical protein